MGKSAKRTGSDDREPPESEAAEWKIRYHRNVKDCDAPDMGHAAMQQVRKVIDKKLKVDPYNYGEPLRRDLKGLHKLKTSDMRIAYQIMPERHEVWILMIGNRRDIWSAEEQSIVSRKGEVAALIIATDLADVPPPIRRG